MKKNEDNVSDLSPLQRSMLVIEGLKSKLKNIEYAKTEPIAIVGMACRFPGEANDPQQFWQILSNGIDTITEIPKERWDIDAYYDPNPEAPGKTYSPYGAFLQNIDWFDPEFFKISPREALSMDPQHRLLLEVSWEALENAGNIPQRLHGSPTGVFIGITLSEYGSITKQAELDSNIGSYAITGLPLYAAAGRLSYTLGLTGPSMAIDTACSSSLVAIHQACQSLRQQECEMALAGGVNIYSSLEPLVSMSQAQMLSPDGHCKTFDALADGANCAEGCGILVLKRLSDAQSSGDRILALIRGSAVNQDGPSSGFTVPNGSSQQKLIRQALKVAKVEPSQVSYIEAHGTGTAIGDPIELRSLAAVFEEEDSREKPLMLGSVKTNIGHTASAAGVSGVIKTILQLQHRQIAPHLHLKNPTPKFNWEQFPVVLPTKLTAWEVNEGSRIAGVSSFGGSGTNAHVVLEEAPLQVKSQKSEEKQERPLHLLTLSAKTAKALEELVSRYYKHLESNAELELADICYTANTGRLHFNHRLAIIASHQQELQEKLLQLKVREEVSGVFSGEQESNTSPPKVAFIFTGQGSQYFNMGHQLYQTQPVFRETLDKCDQILSPLLEHSLLEVIYDFNTEELKSTLLEQTAYTQPALFAIEYALAQLWQSWGIKPDILMGHSVGEYVAATVAGVFSLEDGLKLIATRGRLMQQLPSGGEMVSVMASESKVQSIIQPYVDKVALAKPAVGIAAINGPKSIVISGETEAIGDIIKSLESEEIKTKRLQVSHAFHSPLMSPMLAEFEKVANQLTFNKPRIPVISNVTGARADDSIASAKYWVNHVSQPVRFAEGMKTLHEQDYQVFLEIGPKPILLGMGIQCLPEGVGVWLPSLRPGVDEWQQMVSSLGQLYVQGIHVDWSDFDRDYDRQKVVLPTYPFQRQRYWIEIKDKYHKNQDLSRKEIVHPLLGTRLYCAAQQEQIIFESLLATDNPFYLQDHQVFEQALFPTTAYLEIALAAGLNQFKTSQLIVEDFVIGKGLILPEGEVKIVQTVLTLLEDKVYQFKVFSQQQQEGKDEARWILHAQGKIRPIATESVITSVELEKYKAECNEAIDVKEHYQKCQQQKIHHGVSFQGIQQLWTGSNQTIGQIQLPQKLVSGVTDYLLHPSLLDGALHVPLLDAGLRSSTLRDSNQTYLPVAIEQLKVYARPGLSLWAIGSVSKSKVKTEESLTTQATLVNEDGEIIATVEGLQVKKATPESLRSTEALSIANLLYEVEWRNKARFGRLLPPAFLQKPIEIEQQLNLQLAGIIKENQAILELHSEISTTLEELSVDYIVQILNDIGWPYKAGDIFAKDSAIKRLGIVPTHQRLFNRMLQILAEVGILQETQQQWQVIQNLETLKRANPEEKFQTLLSEYPDGEPQLTLLHRCASQLSEVLRGAIDPVELVFPQGDLSTTSHMYKEAPAAKVMNSLIQKTITKVIEKLPQSRGLRILEIGAGTGGTTSYVLPHLNPSQTEYVFTDIGVMFVTKAQETFRKYPFVRYQTLDIEVDPVTQGLEANQYDLIIASNVLHATTSIKQTLSHVRKLLAPKGRLVLLETITPIRFLDLIFGMLEGWWMFQDLELRPDYPLISQTKWKQLLLESGFSQVISLPETEEVPEILSVQVMILAEANETTVNANSSEPKGWLILADTQGVAQQLATQLRSSGEVCTLVFTGERYQQIAPEEFTLNPNHPEEFEKLIATVADQLPSLYGVVQCWTLEAKAGKNISSQELEELYQLGCGTILSLVQALIKGGLSQTPRLWLVTCGSQPVPENEPVISGVAQSSVWGMGKVISLEHPELSCVRIDLDPQETLENQASVLFSEIWSEDGQEDQVALRKNARYVPRLVSNRHQPTTTDKQKLIPSQPFRLIMSEKGSLDNLTLEPTTRRPAAAGEVEILVKATGLNFLDVVAALGLLPQQVDGVSQQHLLEMNSFGIECAGYIVAVGEGVKGFEIGDSVIAMAAGSFSQYVNVSASSVVIKPDFLSFEEAASIPANFLTAYYALHHVAKISVGDKILIHAAAGGTGMAAVQIAQQAGAEVFATASPPKWEALQQMGVKHIMNSRTVEFADRVMEITEGKGVNVVLNSLTSEEFVAKSLSAVSSQGRFVEIAKRGVWDSNKVAEIRPDLSYFVVDLARTAQEQPELINSMLQELIDKFSKSLLKPPPLKLFPIEEVISAFRYMQQAKHIGKIVVTQTAQQADTTTKEPLSFREDASYLITGGMGGLGLLVARWMVSKGAKHLVLLGRRSPDDAVVKKLTELEQAGAKVVVEKADVSKWDSMQRVFENINKSTFPLAGVIHSAGSLSDGVLLNQSWSSFEKVMSPKVQGAWHLHQLTQNQQLDFFVLFSSIASLFGSPGQGNHSAANGFLDGLAHYRRSVGLPGLSIHWGTVSQVGEAAERGADIRSQQQGVGAITPDQVIESLELVMSTSNVEVGIVRIDWSAWQERTDKWSFLADWKEITSSTTQESKSEFLQKLEAATVSEKRELLVSLVRTQVAKVLGMSNGESIGLDKGFFDLGIDSLTSVELRNKLQTILGCSIPSTLAFDYPTVGKLVDYLNQDLVEKEQISKTSESPNSAVDETEELKGVAKKLAEELGLDL
ncbi:MAG: SDR family NAD(P)-dependent oxidoreductase [Moorea sp. SIOASIH]|uniref:type I polyketide synthase n=1 Tax=Moorena sp. SIOASIH TaxID=2607817 RepID=UPI0013B9AB10|nr:type I polyketide synthase [Moorena sp. SIOASIH]NEO42202.1 SDR family NAD(P)-dependent oxidoreductase [Moorena sp. SIOASIH]